MDVCTAQALWNVTSVSSAVVEWINFVLLTPPTRINHWINACRARPLNQLLSSTLLMWIVNLESLLGPVARNASIWLFRALTTPIRRSFAHNIHALVLWQLMAFVMVIVGRRSIS